MFKISKKIGIFAIGLVVGAILMNLLNMYVRPIFRETIRIDFKIEQEFLASRAAREGNEERALVHRWNVVDAETINGFRAFNKERNKDFDTSFFFPFQMLILKAIMNPNDESLVKGAAITEGLDRGNLALSLESIGAQKEADKQWEIARNLTGKASVGEVKRLILRVKELDNTEAYRQAEEKILTK